jgi:predicted nuclease of predicted toxin-antitoxin system
MKLLIGMNLSPQWVASLNAAGLEAIHWRDVGRATDSDAVIFDWAKAHGYIVFTNDLDFGAILAATNAAGPSVIQLRVQDLMPDRLAPRLIAVLRQFQAELTEGALITVDERRSKARILQIRAVYRTDKPTTLTFRKDDSRFDPLLLQQVQ